MKVLSLFDGISCAQQGLIELGVKDLIYLASEIDKYAISLTQKNHPKTIQVGSVVDISMINDVYRTLFWRDSNGGLRYSHIDGIDLIIGGSPCQDLSIAKKGRKGLDGSRSGLFYEYVRILKEVKPKYFVLENVNSMPKDAKETITKELFGIEPIMINAALVSAQNRKRLFWVGKLVGDTYEQVKIELPEDRKILLRDILEPKVDECFYIKPKSNTVRTSGRGSGINDKHNWDTIRIGQIGKGGQGGRIYSNNGKSVALSANGGGGGAKTGLYAVAGRVIGRRINEQGVRDDYNKDIEIKQRFEINESPEKTNTLSTVEKDNRILENEIIRKLTPIECERLQSLPDNYTEGISNSQRYKALGNAFNVEVVKHILKNIIN